jgi:hypothetical protein
MPEPEAIDHWYQPFNTLSFSTQEFYERLVGEINRREIPDIRMTRVNLPEGGLLQGYRDYLRVTRGKLSFTLCAAPFGIDFFVSWWLLETPAGCTGGCLTAMFPFLAIFARRTTFYEIDTAAIFRDAVHQAVLDTIDGIFSTRETKPDFDRKPVVRRNLVR